MVATFHHGIRVNHTHCPNPHQEISEILDLLSSMTNHVARPSCVCEMTEVPALPYPSTIPQHSHVISYILLSFSVGKLGFLRIQATDY